MRYKILMYVHKVILSEGAPDDLGIIITANEHPCSEITTIQWRTQVAD
jgi:hypothetical protein